MSRCSRRGHRQRLGFDHAPGQEGGTRQRTAVRAMAVCASTKRVRDLGRNDTARASPPQRANTHAVERNRGRRRQRSAITPRQRRAGEAEASLGDPPSSHSASPAPTADGRTAACAGAGQRPPKAVRGSPAVERLRACGQDFVTQSHKVLLRSVEGRRPRLRKRPRVSHDDGRLTWRRRGCPNPGVDICAIPGIVSRGMRGMGRAGIGAIGLGIVLLIVGIAASSDLLGFFFMVCLVVGLILVISDLIVQRRSRSQA